jgi:hypothetical protein
LKQGLNQQLTVSLGYPGGDLGFSAQAACYFVDYFFEFLHFGVDSG